MGNPLHHSMSSVKRWGGKVDDYLPIHELLDSPKALMNDNASRMLTHNVWFCYHIIPKIFGYNIVNSNGKSVDSVDIAMLHLAEDFRMKFIPTAQDYLQHLVIQKWMMNGVKDVENPIATQLVKTLRTKIKKYNDK